MLYIEKKGGGYGYLELTDFANTQKSILLPERVFFRTSWLELPVRGAGQGGAVGFFLIYVWTDGC